MRRQLTLPLTLTLTLTLALALTLTLALALTLTLTLTLTPTPTPTLALTSRPDAPAEGAETHASKPSPQQRAWQGEARGGAHAQKSADRASDSAVLVATPPRST